MQKNRRTGAVRIALIVLFILGGGICLTSCRRSSTEKFAITIIREAFKHPSPIARARAIECIQESGEDVARLFMPEIRETIVDTVPMVRNMALSLLATLGDQSVVGPLEEMVQTGDQETTCWALQVLPQVGSPEVLDMVIGALDDSDPSVRFHAVLALADHKDSMAIEALFRASGDEVPQIANTAAAALGNTGDTSLIPRLQTMVPTAPGVSIALAKLGNTDVLPTLREGLTHSNAGIRAGTAMVLAEVGDTAAIPRLRSLLRDTDETVCFQALLSLARLGDRTVVPELERLLFGEDDSLAILASAGLNELGQESAIPSLKKALMDEDPRLRARAVNAFVSGSYPDTLILPYLTMALDDEVAEIQFLALRGLEMRSSEAARQVVRAAFDQNELRAERAGGPRDMGEPWVVGIREYALLALVRMGDRTALPLLADRLNEGRLEEFAQIDIAAAVLGLSHSR